MTDVSRRINLDQERLTQNINVFALLGRLFLGTLIVCGSFLLNDVQAAAYKINAGDILNISVWKEEGLDRDVLVRPGGGISFPLVGDIKAEGMTIEQLRLEVTSRLSKYIPDPVVTVSLMQVQGNRAYVIGHVNKPGEFMLARPTDVMQALSMAGGVNSFASLNDIIILRRNGQTQVSIPFRYKDVAKGKGLEQNIILQSGDVVVVP